MERYVGQPLSARPHVGVVASDQIGSLVVLTPLLFALRETHTGACIDYFGGERTRELEEASVLVDARFSIFGRPDALRALPAFIANREATAGVYDLVINSESSPVAAMVVTSLSPRYVVGQAYQPGMRDWLPQPLAGVDGLHAETWSKPDLLERYSGTLQSQYIGEIFCRLARVETDFYRTEIPVAEPPTELRIPPVLIATGGTRSAKLWPVAYWESFLAWCQAHQLEAGLIGAAPRSGSDSDSYCSAEDDQRLLGGGWLVDLRGTMSLPQVAGALRRAQVCVSIDNGILHLAAGVGTRTIGLYGATPASVWAPRVPNLQPLLSTDGCTLCEEHRFQNRECLLNEHRCMLSIRPERVIQAVSEALR
jgi:heptosyltransferase III